MNIQQRYFVAGAREARGVAIVIDVFRACSLVAHALAAGARRIVPVAGIDEAKALKVANPEWILVGERHARKLPGFECGNSPSDLLKFPLAGRTVIHTTHAGTQGLTAAAAAPGVQVVLTGALANAGATVRHVLALAPDEVTLIAMGHEARERCVEDDLCAELLEARLLGLPFDLTVVEPRLRAAPAAAKFFDPAADWAPEADFALCSTVDAVDFAVQLVRRPGENAVLERVA